MIPAVQQNFPPPEAAIVDSDGKMTQPGRFLLLALFTRTGSETGIPLSVGEQLVATGSTQADALALADDINEFTSVPSGSGASLFQMQPGMLQIVFNVDPANSLSVYPAPGYAIDALAADGPYALANGKTQIFFCTGLNQIRSLQLG